MPRIRTLVAESHTEENEVKSEAQFQRLVSSFSEHPTMPRTPRALSDRGRYPEDATLEEPSHDADSSDEEDECAHSSNRAVFQKTALKKCIFSGEIFANNEDDDKNTKGDKCSNNTATAPWFGGTTPL